MDSLVEVRIFDGKDKIEHWNKEKFNKMVNTEDKRIVFENIELIRMNTKDNWMEICLKHQGWATFSFIVSDNVWIYNNWH